MKKAYCMNCQKVIEAVLVSKKEYIDQTETQCMICGKVTASMPVRDIKFKPDEWRHE